MATKSLILFMLFLCASFHCAQPTHRDNKYQWDLLIFTQSWPLTVCQEWKNKNPHHTCTMPKKTNSWSIHGVWPTKLHTIGPVNCNNSWHFDPEQVKPIESSLMESWVNIEAETSQYSLWTHEWTKHGTCAAQLPALNSEFKYFSKGLEWMQTFSMAEVLASSNIVPSNDKGYQIADIHTAIVTKLKVNPAIECRVEHGKSWLVEIRICFSKSFELIDCDGIKFIRESALYLGDVPILTNCHVDQEILYPTRLPYTGPMYVNFYKLITWLQWLTL